LEEGRDKWPIFFASLTGSEGGGRELFRWVFEDDLPGVLEGVPGLR